MTDLTDLSVQDEGVQQDAIAALCGINLKSLRTCSLISAARSNTSRKLGHRSGSPRCPVASPFGLGQRRAKSAGSHAHFAAEDRGEMALVGEPGLLCDQSEGLGGSGAAGFLRVRADFG